MPRLQLTMDTSGKKEEDEEEAGRRSQDEGREEAGRMRRRQKCAKSIGAVEKVTK